MAAGVQDRGNDLRAVNVGELGINLVGDRLGQVALAEVLRRNFLIGNGLASSAPT